MQFELVIIKGKNDVWRKLINEVTEDPGECNEIIGKRRSIAPNIKLCKVPVENTILPSRLFTPKVL